MAEYGMTVKGPGVLTQTYSGSSGFGILVLDATAAGWSATALDSNDPADILANHSTLIHVVRTDQAARFLEVRANVASGTASNVTTNPVVRFYGEFHADDSVKAEYRVSDPAYAPLVDRSTGAIEFTFDFGTTAWANSSRSATKSFLLDLAGASRVIAAVVTPGVVTGSHAIAIEGMLLDR